MKQNSDAIIDQLKKTLTLQLEAYQNEDWSNYDDLEKQLLLLEKKI